MKIILLFFVILSSCKNITPTNLGLQIREVNGRKIVTLGKCPESPACISSLAPRHSKSFHKPIEIIDSKEKAYQDILKWINLDKNFKIVQQNEKYIRTEYTSSLLTFIDDVEFFFSGDGFVHFRSASRVGFSDFGANKKRIEDFRFKYLQRSL